MMHTHPFHSKIKQFIQLLTRTNFILFHILIWLIRHSYLCLCRVVRGAVGNGDAYCIEMARLCGSSNALCDFCLLCCIDHLHPANHGGTLSFPTRASFTLVRKFWRKYALILRMSSLLFCSYFSFYYYISMMLGKHLFSY